ncbi:MAG: hypothetical protein E7263_08265 [Lachnospiraceae bacterium]|nr:hypothetical protein [Lachnospiraceae bacterium]
MKKALQELTESQIEFICNECSVTEEELHNMEEDQLYDDVYETMCNIEIDEVCSKEGGEDTERCEIASDIVTILGNAIR